MTHHTLPSFHALCEAIRKNGVGSPPAEFSPPTTPMELSRDFSYEHVPGGVRSLGWFDAQQEEVQRTWEALQALNLDRDQKYEHAFSIVSDRALYDGEDLNKKKGKQGSLKQTASAKKHSKVEKKRRARHQQWQIVSHRMVSEFAHQCVVRDRTYQSKDEKDASDTDTDASKTKGNKSRRQAAGKDESFCGTIYSLAMCGIVLQSEHEGRKLAERQAEELADRVAMLERQLSMMQSGYSTEPPRTSTCEMHGQRKTSTDAFRAPLPPSPTPTCSTSSNFGH
jgi:hypothetical protein